eukprot:GFYU01004143.1.p1 GENE.GFYU01004143.1~~GFYU01004143.1.p1  ORF type:complete len:891 (-),score=342.92 GFYU01004143.1:154-2826(-)
MIAKRFHIFLALIFVVFVFQIIGFFSYFRTKPMTEVKPVLLPGSIRPVSYRTEMKLNFEEFNYLGKQEIDLTVVDASNKIVLNALELEISNVNVKLDGDQFGATSVDFDADAETVVFQLPKELPAGSKPTVSMDFKGILNDKMAGFYRVKATINGEEKWMATTQFEAVDARRAFPCFDEPAAKAKFQITLDVPKDMTALSNTEPVETKEEGDRKVVKYGETPVMSTYLVAMVVGYYESVEAKNKNGVTVRVWTPPGRTDHGTFALEVGCKTLEFFTEYFAIPYPLEKCDMISVADFSAGAMENWGLITYRETALLFDVKNSSVASKKRVAEVVAHELAHQWFGNLVTMQWWSELWLNEGFATWVGTLAVDHLFKEWNIWTNFAALYQARAYSLDALQTSHPVEVPIGKARDVLEVFDMISYAKGASCIHMIQDLLGPEIFRDGLREYLKRHQYSNAHTTDLWQALTDVSGADVNGIMGDWIKEVGYPVVSVSKPDGTHVKVDQRRFIAGGDEVESKPWYISTAVISEAQSTPVKVVLNKEKSTTAELPGDLAKGSWIKCNTGQFGFHRVQYSSDLLKALGPALRTKAISAVDRIGVQADTFALARAGLVSTVDALELGKSFVDEDDFTVWTDLVTNIKGVLTTWTMHPTASFNNYIVALFKGLLERLTWKSTEGENEMYPTLREIAISVLGKHNEPSVVAEAKRVFKAFLNGEEELPADLRYAVYAIAVINGGDEEFDLLMKRYKEVEMHEEKLRVLRGISATRNSDKITQMLKLSLDASFVRPQDTFYVFMEVAAHREGNVMAWNFLRENWAEIAKIFDGTSFLLPRLVQFTVNGFASTERADEVKAFFDEHGVKQVERTVSQSVETIRQQAAWLTRDGDSVAEWLKQA